MNPAVLSGQTSFFVTFMASFLIWFMFGGLLVLWIIDGRVKKEVALHALMASFIAWGLTQMIKALFPVSRPFEANDLVPMTLTIPIDPSFPSGHAASAFGLAFSIWLHDKKLGLLFVISALLVAWGRVAGNVHYIADVSAGALIGTATAYMVGKLHLYRLVDRR